MDKILVAIYFSGALMITQFLHSWYANKDPLCRRKLGFGIMFSNHWNVDPMWGYITIPVVPLVTFGIILPLMYIYVPSLNTITFEQLLRNYYWIPLSLGSLALGMTIFGTGAAKLLMNITASISSMVVIFSATKDVSFADVLRTWQNLWPVFALVLGLGVYWINMYQKDRAQQYQKDVMSIYETPVIYFFGGLLGWILPMAIIFSIIIALKFF